MLLSTEYTFTIHTRVSKHGVEHQYKRKKTVVVLACDSCGEEFKRDRGSMDPNRISNKFYHVCGSCDVKRFAQEKGVEARHVWNMPASSLKTIDQL
jgi:DNA-directed RNA polymerase subunit RPC12/RpoP